MELQPTMILATKRPLILRSIEGKLSAGLMATSYPILAINA